MSHLYGAVSVSAVWGKLFPHFKDILEEQMDRPMDDAFLEKLACTIAAQTTTPVPPERP